jgi:hypothetical protein
MTEEINFNVIYEYLYILLGDRQKFGSEVIGKTDKERRDNVLFLYKLILKDVLGLTKDEALIAEESLGLSALGRRYVWLLTPTYFEDNIYYKPNIEGLVAEIIYNDWDVDKNVVDIYGWILKNHKGKKKSEVQRYYDFFSKLKSCIG